MSGTSRSQRGRLDMATCHLVKEVLDEHWSVEAAALRLQVLVGDDVGLLCQLRARLRRAAARRRSELTARALVTLDAVLMGYAARGPLTLVLTRAAGNTIVLSPGFSAAVTLAGTGIEAPGAFDRPVPGWRSSSSVLTAPRPAHATTHEKGAA